MNEPIPIEKNPTVTLCISTCEGAAHVVQVGGHSLAKIVNELASMEDIPLQRSPSQIDVVGQDIYVTRDRHFFDSIKGCFTHLSWKSILELPSFKSAEDVVYSFVVSY
tara:strand:- start:686 stop:1009 length:324 start_codon:yes stop_codon:yes gene_type:complete